MPPVGLLIEICDANMIVKYLPSWNKAIVIKNELFENFTVQNKYDVVAQFTPTHQWLNFNTPVSSITKTNLLILQYEDCYSQTLC